MKGVPQLPSHAPLRDVLQISFPSARLWAAIKGFAGSSQRSAIRSPFNAGELLYPHPIPCQLLLITPRSLLQSNFPVRSKQYRPSDPKNASSFRPSVTSVVFACEDFSCLSVAGLPVLTVCSHRFFPVFLSKQRTVHFCWSLSFAVLTSP